MKTAFQLMSAIVFFLFPMMLHGQIQDLKMSQVMSKETFHSCGLEKLNKNEIQQLDSWLNEFTSRVMSMSNSSNLSKKEVVESNIDGEFEGWTGETIFQLMNGQIWQQSSYAYTYHYSYMPKVIIYKVDSGYRMKVDGVSSEISVKQIK